MAAGLSALMSVLPGLLAVGFVVFAYFLLTLDRQRANSLSKDDSQAGLKIVLFAFTMFGIGLAASGLIALLGDVLAGLKGGSGTIKTTLPSIIVGALVVVVMVRLLLPRTNAATQKQAERYFLGAIGVEFGLLALISANTLLQNVFTSAPWAASSNALAGALVGGAVLFIAISRFGALSGWTVPERPVAPPPAQYPPQGGGGYPPQGGGYPPQGGYNPQGGGYPPQGGGYPPQGGGYPPQGGGGYPPR
ncbi:MAG TPA: hypothetical protein VGC41_24095 [Kofleriaceae bacterium]